MFLECLIHPMLMWTKECNLILLPIQKFFSKWRYIVWSLFLMINLILVCSSLLPSSCSIYVSVFQLLLVCVCFMFQLFFDFSSLCYFFIIFVYVISYYFFIILVVYVISHYSFMCLKLMFFKKIYKNGLFWTPHSLSFLSS